MTTIAMIVVMSSVEVEALLGYGQDRLSFDITLGFCASSCISVVCADC